MRALLTMIISLACVSTCRAEVLLNGSFEEPTVTDYEQFFNGQTIGRGWRVLSGNTAYVISENAGQGTTPFGTQFLEIHGDTVAQTVNGLIPGTTYRMLYSATATSTEVYYGAGSITASVGGALDVFNYNLIGSNPYGSPQLPWHTRSIDFVASAPSATVTFTGTSNFALGAIDNISIAAVPEPSSLACFGGMATILAWVRQRAKAGQQRSRIGAG